MTQHPQHSSKIDSLVSVTKLQFIFLLQMVTFLLILSLVSTPIVFGNTGSFRSIDDSHRTFSLAASGNVTDIPYVFQEVNGLCHWATQTMALNVAGVEVDLADVCAITGIGFTSSYLRYEEHWNFISGPSYKQQAALSDIAELYGLETEFYFDANISDFASLFRQTLDVQGVNWTEIDGWDDAFQILKESIDNGYPVEIYVNLYHIPHSDYDFVREIGSSDDDPSHSILITGYNETAGIAYVMDAAIGLLDASEFIPAEDSGFYEINFTSLDLAWRKTYAATVIRPGKGINDDFANKLGDFILDRLRGDRTSYGPESEDVFFWNFGADAYRAVASELTSSGLSLYHDEFDEYDIHAKASILQSIGLEMEAYLTLQYVSYQKALNALPEILYDLNLETFVSKGAEALEHYGAMSNQSSLNSITYSGGATIVTETFNSIAYQYEFVQDGDIVSSVAEYDEELAEIRMHLNAIADAWEAAANALERELHDTDSLLIPSAIGIGAITVLTIAVIRKRRRDAGT